MGRRHKWMQYRFIRKFHEIRSHLPETRKLRRTAFEEMMDKYNDIIVKPNDGRRGKGVFRVTKIDHNEYKVHKEKRNKTIEGIEEAYDYIKKKIGSRAYIVQRRISLATVNKCPMDVRTIVQRKSGSDVWKVTAIVVKVAGKGYIVTNIKRSKGMVLPVSVALKKSSLKGYSGSALESIVKKVAIMGAERFAKLYPGHRIFGFDMGLDKNGEVWIIEVNRFPMMSHFKMLKDKSMYKRIMRYKRG